MFTGTVNFVSASVSRKFYNVELILNGTSVGKAQIDESNTHDFHNDSLLLEATLALANGDQIWLKSSHFSVIGHFTGGLQL